MASHVWIIDASAAKQFGNPDGAPSGLIVPSALLVGSLPSSLLQDHLWLVVRGSKSDSILARIVVEQIDRFEDGLNEGDYLLTVNQLRSFRLSGASKTGQNFSTGATASIPMGIEELAEGVESNLEAIISAGLSINFRKFAARELSSFDLPDIALEKERFAEETMRRATSGISVDRIWGSKVPAQLPPFANLATQKIADAFGNEAGNGYIGPLAKIDPLSDFFLGGNQRYKTEVVSPGLVNLDDVRIDTRLVEIDPAKLHARKFIARRQEFNVLQDALKMTEAAEAAHQDMLRDIAKFLMSHGLAAFQSMSIDLAMTNGSMASIFEIKTANVANVHMQIAKGVYQLLRYKSALETQERRCLMTLVVSDLPYPAFKAHIEKMLGDIGIGVLHYHADRAWPERLKGLMECIP